MIQIVSRGASSRAASWRGATLAVVFSAVLAACGGGGGGSSPPPVSIQASATSTNASGQNITLTATVANSTSTPTWQLSGPGSLSATSGTSVTYIPPDSENDANDGAATATVTASADGHSQQLQITLAAKAFPGHHWTLAGAPAGDWETVAYANGLFVTGGPDGVIATSPDGTTWTRRDTTGGEDWSSIVYTPAGWLMLDTMYNGFLASTDGLAWTSKSLPAAAAGMQTSRLLYANGTYVLLGYSGGSLASTDGTHWTASTVTGTALTYGNGVFVAAGGTGGVNWSADGITWTAASVPSTLDEVGFNNGLFMATDGSHVYTSADGKTWALAGAPSTYIDDDMSFTSIANTMYATGILGVFTSTDDLAWTSVTMPVEGVSQVATGGGKFVAVSYYGAIATGPDAAHLTAVVPPTGGTLGAGLYAHGRYLWTSGIGLRTSTDGTTWSQADFAPGGGLVFTRSLIYRGTNGMAAAPDGTVVVAGEFDQPDGTRTVNSSGFAWSTDGVTWNFAHPQGNTATSNDVGTGPVIHDGTRFLSIGSTSGYIHTSPDGQTWTNVARITLPTGGSIVGLAYANGVYVAVGGGGYTATSTDGLHWTAGNPVSSPGASSHVLNMNAVAYSGGTFVAVGSDAVAATSTDGVNWTAVATAAPPANPDDLPVYLNGLAVDASGEFVAVGNNALVETTRDGVHWTLRQTGRHEQFVGVATTPTGFMIGADNDTVLFSSN